MQISGTLERSISLKLCDFFSVARAIVVYPTEEELGAAEFNNVIVIDPAVRDFYFVLPVDEYTLLKECLPRHSIGYDSLDLAIPAGNGNRAFTCSENELRDVIESVERKFPLGKALVNLIRQQWQPKTKSRNKKQMKSTKR